MRARSVTNIDINGSFAYAFKILSARSEILKLSNYVMTGIASSLGILLIMPLRWLSACLNMIHCMF